MYVYMYVYIHMYVYIYIYIYIEDSNCIGVILGQWKLLQYSLLQEGGFPNLCCCSLVSLPSIVILRVVMPGLRLKALLRQSCAVLLVQPRIRGVLDDPTVRAEHLVMHASDWAMQELTLSYYCKETTVSYKRSIY